MNKYREGKVKSTPMRGVKQTLKPNAYKQREPWLRSSLWNRGCPRTFCIMGQRVGLRSKLKPLGVGVAKASLNRATELLGLDPKPGDLAMDRLKVR